MTAPIVAPHIPTSREVTLRSRLWSFIGRCIDAGFSYPITVTLVGAGGSVQVTRLLGQDEPDEDVASDVVGDGFRWPLTVLVVDAAGQSARFTLGPDLALQSEH